MQESVNVDGDPNTNNLARTLTEEKKAETVRNKERKEQERKAEEQEKEATRQADE